MKCILVILFIFSSCSFKKTNQTLKGHEELYSEPDAPSLTKLSKQERRIVIASTNDVHGVLNPTRIEFFDKFTNSKQDILVGGKKTMGEYFKSLRNFYGEVLLVDSGDIFSNSNETQSVLDFYNQNNYSALTVGLRDFNIQVSSKMGSNTKLFQEVAKNSNVPFLLSNLYELKTARQIEWPGTKGHLIKEVNGVKVGIIGLISDDIVAQTPVQNRVGLYVENMLQASLKQARLLRSLGADIIVVLTHQSLDCSTKLSQEMKLPPTKVNFDPLKNNVCDLSSPLGEYLERLPPSLVDIVIAGRNEFKMANIINGTIVMAGMSDGKGFSFSELVFDIETKKINFKKSVIHQPITFCHEFFKETNDCFTEDESIPHDKRIPAKFLGQKIDSSLDLVSAHSGLKKSIETIRKISEHKASIAYLSSTTGETQLILMQIPGDELARILEEDFNKNQKKNWIPNPFTLKEQELYLKIDSEEIDLRKTYLVLADLESIQKHPYFHRKVSDENSVVLMNHSWKSKEQDEIQSFAAAPER
jgi:hypothetical protein